MLVMLGCASITPVTLFATQILFVSRLPIYRVRISSWISSWIFESDFRVGFSSWIFELGFFGGIFFGGFFYGVSIKFSVVLHNVLCQRCCTSYRGLFKMEEN